MKPFSTPVLAKRTYRELKLLKHLKHENVSDHHHSPRQSSPPWPLPARMPHLMLMTELGQLPASPC